MSTGAISLLIGFVLDMIVGDPYWLPHPIRWIGMLIDKMEVLIRELCDKKDINLLTGGIIMVVFVVIPCIFLPWLLLKAGYGINTYVGITFESVMCYQILALKSLKVESMKVYHAIDQGDTEKARANVSMIVGRDTDNLDEKGMIKAAVETVAENASDGVIAPMLFIALGGPVLGFAYKAVNTMDSMIGYKNDKYIYFGRAAARLDDVLNYMPSRLSACLMILASFMMGLDYKNVVRIYKRDRRKHASPNSAQTESVCAGALGIQLAGDAYYFGVKHEKPAIGEEKREVSKEDIAVTNRLVFIASFISLILCTGIRCLYQFCF